MRVKNVVLPSFIAMSISACGGGGSGGSETIMTGVQGLEQLRDDQIALVNQVCDTPVYSALLGFHRGEFSVTQSGRSCTWDVSIEMTGRDNGLLCVISGTFKSTTTFQEPDDLNPYTCNNLDVSFSVSPIPTINLDTFPQTSVMSFPVGTTSLTDDEGFPLVSPFLGSAIFSVNNNLMLLFRNGQTDRVGDLGL